MRAESRKLELSTSIIDHQRKISQLPDLDSLRAKITDLQSEILAKKLAINNHETDLVTLKNAVENLYSYLPDSKLRQMKTPKTIIGQLDYLLKWSKDMQAVLEKFGKMLIKKETLASNALLKEEQDVSTEASSSQITLNESKNEEGNTTLNPFRLEKRVSMYF